MTADGVTLYSERAGGRYAITVESERRIQSLNDSEKARLTTWLLTNEQISKCQR